MEIFLEFRSCSKAVALKLYTTVHLINLECNEILNLTPKVGKILRPLNLSYSDFTTFVP